MEAATAAAVEWLTTSLLVRDACCIGPIGIRFPWPPATGKQIIIVSANRKLAFFEYKKTSEYFIIIFPFYKLDTCIN